MTPLLELLSIEKEFPRRSPLLRRTIGSVHAVDGAELAVHRGKTVGLVGESGCGKSTLGRIALGLLEPSSGRVLFEGIDVRDMRRSERGALRRELQFVFQDPYSSLDPFVQVADSVAEPMRTHRTHTRGERDERVRALLRLVGLPEDAAFRYPREFSGGQLQRVAIARAIALDPSLIVLDEPVSSLDVSTQGEVINVLAEIQATTGVAYLFISHDLAVVEHVSDEIAVMYLGRIVERGAAKTVVRSPKHPYTLAMLSAVPGQVSVDGMVRQRIILQGDLPSPSKRIEGCRFHTRCPFAMDVCRTAEPEPYVTPDNTVVECHLHTGGPQLAGASVTELPVPHKHPVA